MNEELAAYITRLCELSGHTARIDDDLILIEPDHGSIYDAFTMVKEYYAYGEVDTSARSPWSSSRSSRSCTSPPTFAQHTSSHP